MFPFWIDASWLLGSNLTNNKLSNQKTIMSKWSDAVAVAQKALGKDGKLPKPRVDPALMQVR